MKYAILGGGGSFGIHCAFYLLQQPETEAVYGIGRNPLRAEPFSLNIDKQVKYRYRAFHVTHELDLLLEYLYVIQPETIINFAAQGEGAVSWKHSWRFFETNSMALARLAEELGKRSWMKRFIQIGTSELYGSVSAPSKEDDPIKPTSPYAASKAAFDMYLITMDRARQFPMNIIRPSNAYGPGQLLHRVIPRALLCGLTGQKLPLHGGGRAEKSYIHARDLARAIHLVAQHAPLGEVYNVGADKPVSIRAVVEMCAFVLGIDSGKLIEEVPDRLGQDSRYWLDSSKINALGWRPRLGLEHGVQDVADWARKYLPQLRNTPTEYQLRA